MGKKEQTKVIPQLPDGIRVSEREANLEFYTRSRSKWIPVVQAMQILDTTKCVEIDITGATKNTINSIKAGIRHTIRDIGVDGTFKCAIKGNTLYVWLNRR